MYRRPPMSPAHISPPPPTVYPGNPKTSQRSFTPTKRICIALVLISFVFLLTHFIYPFRADIIPAHWSNANLKPIVYLNDIGPGAKYPFSFCPAGAQGDLLAKKYGDSALTQTRLNSGTGLRVQRVLKRALMGEPVTISVIGGSVSACHGAGDDPISSKCYPSLFFQWWNSVFPNPASELTNGAMRRTNSRYFAFCNAHHLPDATDLVILEFDVDDAGDKETLTNFEILVRSILLRPDVPAVLILGHFSPQVQETYGWSGPEFWHTQVGSFYDVPHISIKPILYPSYMTSPSSINRHYVDPVLANPSGHILLSDVLIAYFQSQICRAWDIATGRDPGPQIVRPEALKSKLKGISKGKGKADGDPHGLFGGVGERKGVPPEKAAVSDEDPDAERKPPVQYVDQSAQTTALLIHMVPRAMINTRPGDSNFPEIHPWCVSANDLINPLPPGVFYGSGWSAHHPPPGAATASQTPSAHYYFSTLPMSKMRIPMQLRAGDVGIYYLRESTKDVGEGSAVECWVDDNYNGAVLLENAAPDIPKGETRETLVMIDHNVAGGSHYVECQLMGEEEQVVPAFKIVALFAT